MGPTLGPLQSRNGTPQDAWLIEYRLNLAIMCSSPMRWRIADSDRRGECHRHKERGEKATALGDLRQGIYTPPKGRDRLLEAQFEAQRDV